MPSSVKISVINRGTKLKVALAGTQGAPGVSQRFDFTQSTPSDTWVIAHNLGKRPEIQVLDTAGNVLMAPVQHQSVNLAIVSLNPPTAGSAVCIA